VVCLYVIPVKLYFFGNLWGYGFVKKTRISSGSSLRAIKESENIDLNIGGSGVNSETGFELPDPKLVYRGDD